MGAGGVRQKQTRFQNVPVLEQHPLHRIEHERRRPRLLPIVLHRSAPTGTCILIKRTLNRAKGIGQNTKNTEHLTKWAKESVCVRLYSSINLYTEDSGSLVGVVYKYLFDVFYSHYQFDFLRSMQSMQLTHATNAIHLHQQDVSEPTFLRSKVLLNSHQGIKPAGYGTLARTGHSAVVVTNRGVARTTPDANTGT